MNTFVCPHCKQTVEISEAISKEATKLAWEKAQEELGLKFKKLENQNIEQEEKKKELRNEILELTRSIREMQEKDKEREIKTEKKIIAERTRLQEEISKNEQEKNNLEKAELKKQIEDMKKALEEAQRKGAQTSQQLRGEVLELELEEMLRLNFPHDDIQPIGKGVSGADIRHIVKSPRGFMCGVILWEFKRTKEWSDKWIVKLKEDLRIEKAHIPVIVSLEMPKDIPHGFGLKDGVWICIQSLILPLALLLRKNLLDVGYQKAVSANRGEKAELLYGYVTSHEFQHQIENILEAYQEIQNQILKERASFERTWKQREAQAQRILMSTANIFGDIQGRVGTAIPQIKGLELMELEDGK